MFKIVQKQTYTFLSHQYGMLLIFSGIILVIVSAFQFGEVAIEWSQDRYSRLFNIYHDNIANKAFENRMCLPIPIDAVYTWVNGTDAKLLQDLERIKRHVESSATNSSNNSTSSFQCRLKDCIPGALLVTSPLLDRSVTVDELAAIEGSLNKVSKISNVTKDGGKTHTMLQFPKQEDVEAVMKAIQKFTLSSKNYTLSKGYITSDWAVTGSVGLLDRVLITNVGKDTTKDEVKSRIADQYQEHIGEVFVEHVDSVAIVFITNSEVTSDLISDAEKANTTSSLKVRKAYLVWNLEHEESKPDEDYAPNRFEDNEELRYSLRSLEKHAPWIRHIYVITNGQIPSWLNLDNPRLILVSHDEIFQNKSHLPSFSSPAIESHIHRIPGLSKKFIYLNDDTMFGKSVWPDDFYTHASGQKVYLTWPVPNCAEGCPSSWIKDNYCDKACNNSECEWDGGDCEGAAGRGGVGGGIQAGGAHLDQMYCNTGCANGWIADKYCDQACNVPSCGFDAGDCGKANFLNMYSVLISQSGIHVELPKGLEVVYFNVTSIFGEGSTITEGKYDNREAVRTATIAQKFKTVHLLLYKNMSEANLTFHIAGKSKDETPLNVTFNVTVNTKENKDLNLDALLHGKKEEEKPANETKEETEQTPFEFDDVSKDFRGPKVPLASEKDVTLSHEPKEAELTEGVASQLKELANQLAEGEITQKGHDRLRAQIISLYMMSPEYTKHLQDMAHGKRAVADKEAIPDAKAPAGDDLGKVPGAADGQLLGIGDSQQQLRQQGQQVVQQHVQQEGQQQVQQQLQQQGQQQDQGQDIAQQIIQMQKQRLNQDRQQALPGQEVPKPLQGKDGVVQQLPQVLGQGLPQDPQGGLVQPGVQDGAVLQQGQGTQLGRGQQVVGQVLQQNLGAGVQPGFQGGQQFVQQGNQGLVGAGQQNVAQQQLQGQNVGQLQFQGQNVGQQQFQGQNGGQQQFLGQNVGQQQFQGQNVGQPQFQGVGGQAGGQGQKLVQVPQGQQMQPGGQVPLGQNAGQGLGQNAGQLLGQNAGQGLGQNAGQGLGQNAGQILGQNAGQGFGQNAGQDFGKLPLAQGGVLTGQGQGIGLDNQVIQGNQNAFQGVAQHQDARDAGLNLGQRGFQAEGQDTVHIEQGNVINNKLDIVPDALPLQGQGGVPQGNGKDQKAELEKEADAFDEMLGFVKLSKRINGIQPRQRGGVHFGEVEKNAGEVPAAQVLQQDVGDAMVQGKLQVDPRGLDAGVVEGVDVMGQLQQIDNGGINVGVAQDDNDLEEGGGMGADGGIDDPLGNEIKPVEPLARKEQVLKDTRDKYKHIADQFEARREIQLGKDENKLHVGGVQGLDANQAQQEMKNPEKKDDLSEILRARAKVKMQQKEPGHAYQSIDEAGARKAEKQLVPDAQPLGGVGQNLQPVGEANQHLENQVVVDNNVLKNQDNLEQVLGKQDENGQAVNIGRPPIELQNGVEDAIKEKPVGLQGNQADNANQGAEDMDDHRVGNLLKEQNNMPFQLPADVNFDDVNANNRDNAADNENQGGAFQKQDRGFRKLLAHDTAAQQQENTKDSAIEVLVKDVSDVLRSGSQTIRTGEIQMRISLGSFDHEIVKKQKTLDEGHGVVDKANHERNKWSGPSESVPRSGGNVPTEEEAMKMKEEQDRKSSFLPWERTDGFNNLTQILERQEAMQQYAVQTGARRRLMDTFGDSLRHVNKLYNKKFGYQARKVPAHMPHMVDVGIMKDLQSEFAGEYDITSSHQLRHSRDMQYAFSYFYYLMGTPKIVNVTEVFDEFDTDKSGVLSDREIRTLATRLYDLPLDLKTLTSLENIMITCAENITDKLTQPEEAAVEKYYEEKMPQVTKDLLMHCPPLIDKMQGSVKGQTMYKYEIMGEDEIAFKMIQTNVSQVIGQLDDIRKNPKKFVCLNDNIDHKSSDAYMVKAVLQDFYESLFPIPSQFELPREYRNRFLHINELREWRRYRDWLRFWTHLSLGALITFSIVSFCSSHLLALKRRCFGRRRWRGSNIAETVQHV